MSSTRIEHTLAGAIWPRQAETSAGANPPTVVNSGSRFLRDAALCCVGIGLLTLSAKISVPFLPVPMTLQTFAVLCLGTAYGVRLSAITVIAYLLCGLGGMPGSGLDRRQGGLSVVAKRSSTRPQSSLNTVQHLGHVTKSN